MRLLLDLVVDGFFAGKREDLGTQFAPGTVEAELKVADKLPAMATLDINNRHAADTEAWRTSLNLRYDNLWQRDHSVSLTFITAPAAPKQSKVAVITPYLAQPGTQFYVEAFQAVAKEKGWEVNVIDTSGDVAAVISRIEDVVNQGVNAIVINVDPAQVAAGLQTAKAANIPVVGMDAGPDPLLATNVTSDGVAMAATTAGYVVDRIGGKGNVVMFVFDAFPGWDALFRMPAGNSCCAERSAYAFTRDV